MRLMDVQRQRFTEDKESYVDKSTIVTLYYFLNYCFFFYKRALFWDTHML